MNLPSFSASISTKKNKVFVLAMFCFNRMTYLQLPYLSLGESPPPEQLEATLASNTLGMTPLHAAAEGGHLQVVFRCQPGMVVSTPQSLTANQPEKGSPFPGNPFSGEPAVKLQGCEWTWSSNMFCGMFCVLVFFSMVNHQKMMFLTAKVAPCHPWRRWKSTSLVIWKGRNNQRGGWWPSYSEKGREHMTIWSPSNFNATE